jgi:hypothetical protein
LLGRHFTTWVQSSALFTLAILRIRSIIPPQTSLNWDVIFRLPE